MAKDIHKSPFDEGTKAKLAIFQDYLREWLPVFIAKKEIYWKTINIFDFFAGPGADTAGTKGTPLIITAELQPHFDSIISKGLSVNLYFNEYSKDKYQQLKERVIPEDRDLHPYTVEIENLDFKEAFDKHYPVMSSKGTANLLFLDQSGIRHINEDIFKKIVALKTTDFLFFISSSTIKRFSEHPAILQYINLRTEEVENTAHHQIHRLVLEYYRSLIPTTKKYYLAPFSLKKGANLYGLIFGSGNELGIEKFLSTCWKLDPERGEANFDIDKDNIKPGQYDLFTSELQKSKKVDLFVTELSDEILHRKLKTDKDVYLFTITNGFTPSHARNVIKKLIAQKKIEKSTLELSHKICRQNASLTEIKIL